MELVGATIRFVGRGPSIVVTQFTKEMDSAILTITIESMLVALAVSEF